jgi:hypothetical protein
MIRQLVKVAGLVALILPSCTSGDPATDKVIQDGLVGAVPHATHVVDGADECSGAAGSIEPPLSTVVCVPSAMASPVETAVDVLFAPWNAAFGHPAPTPGNLVSLDGLERFWVRQSSDNTCWAAALETARAFLGLQPVIQEELYEMVAGSCPVITEQKKGASMYQIVLAIRQLSRRYDGNKVDPHFCNDIACVLIALQKKRPVLALNAGHVILIAGMWSTVDKTKMVSAPSESLLGTNNSASRNAAPYSSMYPTASNITRVTYPNVIPFKFLILDPAGDGHLEEKHPLEICGSDAFIAM